MKLNQKWSIATRLTINYTLVSTFILLVIFISMHCVIAKLLSTAEKQYLIDEINILQSTLKANPNDLTTIKQEVNGVPASLKNSSYNYFIRIIDYNKNILMQTPGAPKALKGAVFPQESYQMLTPHFLRWLSIDGIPYLLVAAPIQYDQQGKIIKTMQMALDISYPESLLALTINYSILFFILFVLIFLALGKLIAKKALSCIHEMANTTERITAEKLSQRINHYEWPHELKALGLSFNKMISGIETTFTRLNECSNELAHELRIPINNLIGSTEITLSRQRSIDEYSSLLASNVEEFRRLSKLIDNILFIARCEAPDSIIQAVNLDLGSEISKLCEFYKYLALEKKITLHCRGNATINVDPVLFHRAIVNLLINAIKFTPANGNILISIHKNENYVEVKVSDTGIGINEQEMTKIFERFYKIKNVETSQQSFGLGLPIVKSIMHLHGGYVTVVSKQNHGSIFTLHFPTK